VKKLLVLGVGNILMMDEGAGVHAIHKFWKEKGEYDETLVDLLDSLDMARMRGHRPILKIVGIEPDKIDWGTQMTPALTKALPLFMKVAKKHIEKLLK